MSFEKFQTKINRSNVFYTIYLDIACGYRFTNFVSDKSVAIRAIFGHLLRQRKRLHSLYS